MLPKLILKAIQIFWNGAQFLKKGFSKKLFLNRIECTIGENVSWNPKLYLSQIMHILLTNLWMIVGRKRMQSWNYFVNHSIMMREKCEKI